MKICRYWLWPYLLLSLCVSSAQAQVYPVLTGRVVDLAYIINVEPEKELTTQLQKHEQATTDQVVVVTVPSLQGYDIESYSRGLGNFWHIGQKNKNNGVLLVVAPKERRVRIEVGTGLESKLTDQIAQAIINNNILPHFRDNDLAAGVTSGTKSILESLNGTYKAQAFATSSNSSSSQSSHSILKWLEMIVLLPFILISRLLGLGRNSGGSSFSGGGGSFGGGGASGSW